MRRRASGSFFARRGSKSHGPTDRQSSMRIRAWTRSYRDGFSDGFSNRPYFPGMESKRRLPLLRSADDSEVDPARPGWQWVGFGTVAIFVVWLPLSAAAGSVASGLSRGDPGAAPHASLGAAIVFASTSAIALALSALAGGFVVGKWGGRGVGVREASLAGLGTSLVAVVASWLSFGFAPGALLVIPIAVPLAALGGWLGVRSR